MLGMGGQTSGRSALNDVLVGTELGLEVYLIALHPNLLGLKSRNLFVFPLHLP